MSATGEESISTLMARREYGKAVPLLRRDLEKYPSNVRIRLQYADALAGAGEVDEAITQYGNVAKFYEDNNLIVQAIAVRKKLEKVQASATAAAGQAERSPRKAPDSPLFEDMTPEERNAVIEQMVLETFAEGDIVITEGEEGSSLYVVVTGEVKVYTRGPKKESFYLATLGAGDFFGEVSVLTGKPRTATITASTKSELLRLDKDKLDIIVVSHPRVREILDQFYRKRAAHTVEAMIESLKSKKG